MLAFTLPVRTGQSSSAGRRGIGAGAPLPAATTFTVNSVADTADTNVGDGHCDTDGNLSNGDQCTLRAAIQEGQVGNQGHSINFNLPSGSVITLNTQLPGFVGNVTIVGPGSNQLTIQRSTAGGTPNFTIFFFAPINGNFNDSISGLTIANGNNPAGSGAGIGSGGCLNNMSPDVVTLTDMTLRGCTAQNGGAISNGGTVTLTDSTIDGNTASGGAGGGIYNTTGGFNGDGTLTLIRTTVSNNSANAQGGAIANVNSGVVTLTNSTISGNSTTGSVAAGDGGITNMASGTVNLTNATVTANTAPASGAGGIGNVTGTINIGNSIVAKNTGGFSDLKGAFNSQGYNLIGLSAGSGLNNGINNDQVGSPGAAIDPLLGALADNGGATKTHALLVGSPAIDAGNSSQTTDQRGRTRPVDDPNVANASGGNGSDIGAYETNPFQVNTTADADDGACTAVGIGNGCTLREAVNAANSSPGDISFAPALTSGGPATINLLTALPTISSRAIIEGPGANLLTIQRSSAGGTPNFAVFSISNTVVTISGLTIANGNQGGVVNTQTALTINNCVITGNSGAAAITSRGSTLTVNQTTVSNNTAGGIDSEVLLQTPNPGISASLTVNNSTISGNSSTVGFGGIQNLTASNGGNAVAIINNSTISGNTSSFSDGVGGINNTAIIGGNPSLFVTNSTVYGNNSDGSSGIGGISNNQTSCTSACIRTIKLKNTIVAGNLKSGSSANDISGPIDLSSSFNLIGTGGSGGLSNGVNNNQVGVASPGLSPLANNGGPTMTHALLSTSPALDAGDNCVTQSTHCGDSNISQLTTDQRGFNRIVDGPDADTTATVDIGAYEGQAPLANLPDTSTNEDTQLTVGFDPGDTSTITSVTATSSNATLVPNDAGHLNASITGANGSVVINPAVNLSGTTNITVTVNRTVGGSDVKTFMLTVNAVNDAPTITKGPDQVINEDAGAQTVSNWASNISPGPADESGQTLTIQVSNSNPGLFSAAPAVSLAGTLSYTPAANANGTATITVTLTDNGGTANGGVDTTSVSFVIAVNSVNDAPSFTKGPDKTFNEDTGPQSVSPWATNVSAGPSNESGQTLTFVVTNNTNAALFSSGPTVSSNGQLSFTQAPNANGSATITIVLKDNGGTANGGVDTSPPQTFTITINPVNDAPSFTKGANQTVLEDAGAQTVTSWATNILAGPADESTQTLSFQITNNTRPTLFSVGPAISATGTLTFTPAADANGSATITINLKDNGGTANGGIDTSASQTFTISVTAVNDPPSFTKGPNSVVNEDAGAQTVTSWATNISVGPANESAQILTFTATNDNNALFSAQPAISASGTLTFTPAPDANGVATVTVTLKDNGGTANGGADTSPSQSFTITVSAVNDAPSFTKGADQTVNNNVGAQTVANWATGISAGPADESGQTVAFQVTGNTNVLMFSVQPAISPTGTLTYTPASNAGGTATITINLKDNGGTANGGVDTSASQSFTITVNPIGGFIAFASASSNTTENSGSTTITVTRTGDSSRAATVDYATNADSGLPCSTASGVASPKCDFTAALGTLSFAAGDTSRTITILISQDSFVEGSETITVTLSNQTGGSALTSPSTTSITIADDATEPPTNIIDDPNMFVRMHYHDFLNREADQSGLDFWTGQITSCGSDAACTEVRRINVSAAFFLSIEFQQTGYLVERMYKTAYGDATGTSTLGSSHQLAVPIVRFNEFLKDTQRIGQGVVVLAPGWEQALENNKQAYASEFVATSRFISAFPTTMTPAQFVDKLNQNAGNVLSASERTTAINLFSGAADSSNTTARAQALRQVAEDQDLYNAEFNRAFVLTEYMGYLRRNPNDLPDSDYTGYEFWLNKLNQFNGDYINAEMVKAFISSSEYRQRFGQ